MFKSPVFICALDGEEVALPFAEPELATVALRLEVEELDGVQQVRLSLGRLLFDVLESRVEGVGARLQRRRRDVVGSVEVFDVFDHLHLVGKNVLTVLRNALEIGSSINVRSSLQHLNNHRRDHSQEKPTYF